MSSVLGSYEVVSRHFSAGADCAKTGALMAVDAAARPAAVVNFLRFMIGFLPSFGARSALGAYQPQQEPFAARIPP